MTIELGTLRGFMLDNAAVQIALEFATFEAVIYEMEFGSDKIKLRAWVLGAPKPALIGEISTLIGWRDEYFLLRSYAIEGETLGCVLKKTITLDFVRRAPGMVDRNIPTIYPARPDDRYEVPTWF